MDWTPLWDALAVAGLFAVCAIGALLARRYAAPERRLPQMLGGCVLGAAGLAAVWLLFGPGFAALFIVAAALAVLYTVRSPEGTELRTLLRAGLAALAAVFVLAACWFFSQSAEWFPLWNSLRIAGISTVIIFFVGIFAAYYIAKAPRLVKGVLDVILTLPLVLPPTVVGYLLLRVLGPKRVIGAWVLETFGFKMVMTWWSAIFATTVVIFPLMYRTVRGAFESFDDTLSYAGKTLGLSNTYIFWRIRMPYCRQGILAGTVLAFARALGEYGATSMIAGYTPGKTATISTTVYQLWRTDDDAGAMQWVLINLAISAVVLLAVNMMEKRNVRKRGAAAPEAAAEGGG